MKKRKLKPKSIILFHPKLTPANKGQVSFAPLSILAVAAPLEQQGFDLHLIDSNCHQNFNSESVDTENLLCVGISAMTGYQIHDGIEFAKTIRKINKDIPVIWGGVHVSLLPDQSMKSPWVDYVVTGQGEITFLELALCLERKSPVQDVAGILYKENGKIKRTRERAYTDVNQLPPMPYHLIDMDMYFKETREKKLRSSDAFLDDEKRFLYYCSSFGCPYRCRFCASSKIVSAKWTALDAQRVINEIVSLVKRYRINCLQFCDAEFFIDPKRAKTIAQGFIDNNLNLLWKAQVRANTFDRFDDDMMRVLKQSGYIHVEIGVESGSQRMLDHVNKKIKVSQVLQCAQKNRKYGMLSSFCFVFGFPNETAEDRRQSYYLASRLKAILPDCLLPVYFFDPYPAVPLYHESLELGMKPPVSFEEWAGLKPDMREPSPLVPWQNKSLMDQVHRVIIFYLPLAYPADIGLGTLTYVKRHMAKGPWKLVYRLAHKLAHLRVRHQFFDYPIEWIIFKTYGRVKRWFNRRLSKIN